MDKEAIELIKARNELLEVDNQAYAMQPEKRKYTYKIDWKNFKIVCVPIHKASEEKT